MNFSKLTFVVVCFFSVSPFIQAQDAVQHITEAPAKGETQRPMGAEKKATDQCEAMAKEAEGKVLEGLPFLQTKSERQQMQGDVHSDVGVFQAGEKIKGKFFLRVDREKKEIHLLNMDAGDVRHADTFIMSGDAEYFSCLEGYPLEGSVEVTGPGKYHVSNMYHYPAMVVALRRMGLKNPDAEALLAAERGSEVVVEGTLTAVPAEEVRDGIAQVMTPEGKTISVTLLSGLPKYEDSLSSKIDSASVSQKGVEKGDKVRLLCFKTSEGGIGCHWCRSAYLLEPSESRLKAYTELKKQNEDSFASLQKSLKQSDFKGVRKSASEILRREPNPSETQRLDALMEKLPKNEQPMRKMDRYYVDSLNRQFGRDFESMSAPEMIQFARDFADRKIKSLPGESGDETYLWRVLDGSEFGKAYPRDMIELRKRAVRNRVEYMKELAARNAIEELTWPEKYTTSQSINELAYDLHAENATEDDKKFVKDLVEAARGGALKDALDGYYVGLLYQNIDRQPIKK